MGVKYLLPLLGFARKKVHVGKTFQGQFIIVDGFVWLHEAVAHHAREVVVKKNFSPVVNELVWRCLQYLQRGRRVLIVLDGTLHSSKHTTKQARMEKRVRAQMAVELALEDDPYGYSIEHSTLTIAAAVSEDLVNAFIDNVRKHGIAFLRAPYEADGQLVYCSLQHPDD